MAVFGFEVQTWKEGLLLSHVVAGLVAAYCYYLVTKLSLGLSRFISCMPVFVLYAYLPFIFNRSTHILGVAGLYCILTWISSFKILLLCWGHGPGSESSSFPRFAIVMTYPAHVKRTGKVVKRVEYERFSSWWEHVSKSEVWHALVLRSLVKIVVLALLLYLLSCRDALPGMILHLLLSFQLYLLGTIVLELLAAVASALFGVTLEPHFDNPFAADSLEEFWGRRWNVLVSNCLRETVYHPVLSLLGGSPQEIRGSKHIGLAPRSRRSSSSESVPLPPEKDKQSRHASPEAEFVGKQQKGRRRRRRFDWPKLVAMLAAFLVSGLCHEGLVYYSTLKVTWEMVSFFLVQGVAVAVEGAWKLAYPATRPPRGVATLGTLGFVFLSAHWLFWPPLDGISEQVEVELRRILHTSRN